MIGVIIMDVRFMVSKCVFFFMCKVIREQGSHGQVAWQRWRASQQRINFAGMSRAAGDVKPPWDGYQQQINFAAMSRAAGDVKPPCDGYQQQINFAAMNQAAGVLKPPCDR